jgi:hypothetical protein
MSARSSTDAPSPGSCTDRRSVRRARRRRPAPDARLRSPKAPPALCERRPDLTAYGHRRLHRTLIGLYLDPFMGSTAVVARTTPLVPIPASWSRSSGTKLLYVVVGDVSDPLHHDEADLPVMNEAQQLLRQYPEPAGGLSRPEWISSHRHRSNRRNRAYDSTGRSRTRPRRRRPGGRCQ